MELIRASSYLDGILIEYDHLATKFKPLVPKQPRPSLLPRHVSENLPKSLPVSRNTAPDYEQIKQKIFEHMKALVDKEALCVQVFRDDLCLLVSVLCFGCRTFLSCTGWSQAVQRTRGPDSSEMNALS
jgi:hypothetical protein